MSNQNNIQEIFFKFLSQFQYKESDLDYNVVSKHIPNLEVLSEMGHSGVNIFDFNKKQHIFYSANFGKSLGYEPSDYEVLNCEFFEQKIHPDDSLQLASNSVSILKIFNSFSREEKLSHKSIYEYRMCNAENKYVRLVEQYQMLELDKKGQIWLIMSVVDISPNQEENTSIKCQLLNFQTGNIIPFENVPKMELELTKRETEILKLVKDGYLSKEISDILSISVHTVNTHRQRFLEKLGANNSVEAIRFASKFGLIA
jgi:DNA-binding CsgD family transcriptional regulator